jgi:fatty-acid desaturase
MGLLYIPPRLTQYVIAVLITTMLVLGCQEFIMTWQDFSNQWYWLIIATYYTITVNETFSHRAVTHGMIDIDVNSWTYKFLVFLTAVDQCHGPVRALTLLHITHHKYSDRGYADHANFRCFWFGHAWVMPFVFFGPQLRAPDFGSLQQRMYKKYKHIIDDPWTIFCERYGVLISCITLIAMYFLMPIVLFKIVLMGRFIMTLGMMTVSACHVKWFPFNYRHYNTKDESSNNLILHYMFLGIFSGLLQNAHHAKPKAMSMSSAWYEIDSSTPVAYVLRFLMSKKLS